MRAPRQIGAVLAAVAVLLFVTVVALAVVVNNRLGEVEGAQETGDLAREQAVAALTESIAAKKQTRKVRKQTIRLTRVLQGEPVSGLPGLQGIAGEGTQGPAGASIVGPPGASIVGSQGEKGDTVVGPEGPPPTPDEIAAAVDAFFSSHTFSCSFDPVTSTVSGCTVDP